MAEYPSPSNKRAPFLFVGLFLAGLFAIGTFATLTLAAPAAGQNDKVLYLTYDDGPSNQFTWSILDALDDYGAKATFFPIGSKFSGTEDLVRSMVERGHQVGNHTMTHPNLPSVADPVVRRELDDANKAIEALIGVTPTCMRPPSGSSDDRVDGIIASFGLSKILWNRGGNDYGLESGDAFLDRVRNSQSGDIILLHDPAGPKTVDATRKVLDHFTREGFRFETVPQCRSIVPATTTSTTTTTTTTAPTTTSTTAPTTTSTTVRPPSTTTTTPTTTMVPVPDSPIVIRAQGTTGTEIIKLEVNNKIVAGFRLTTEMRDFRYIPRKPARVKTVRVIFENDGDHQFSDGRTVNRNVRVDLISIKGKILQTEARKVKSRGAWAPQSGCKQGFKRTELLSCNGWFRYQLSRRIRITPNG